ncbi:MAG TPA: hypothetical protein VD971_04945 [Phycisphaerales bacterium]|nr:hypothetical protein [Phycisphaerales bacterium]
MRNFAAILPCVALCACASVPRSSRLTTQDFTLLAADVAAALNQAPAIRERDAASPRWTIAMNKAENLSNDLIPSREQWALVTSVRDHADLVRLGREKNFALIIPAERLREGLASGSLEPGTAADRAPTHELAATILSVSRSAITSRADVYVCEFRLTEIGSGELLWSQTFDIKRAAHGLSFD